MTTPGAGLHTDRPRKVITRRDDAEPDLTRLLGAVARAVLEVEAGRRPLWQLEGIVSPAVLGRLAVRDERARRASRQRRRPIVGPGPTVVRTVVAQRPSAWACEGTVIVEHGTRVLPLAIRAERYRDGWRIVALDRPHEAGR